MPTVRLPASLRGDAAELPPRFRSGTVEVADRSIRWRSRRPARRGSVTLSSSELELLRVRDTVPSELLRLDRSAKVAVFWYRGGALELAVAPADLPLLRAALRAIEPGR